VKHSLPWAGFLIGVGAVLILLGSLLGLFWLVLVGLGAVLLGFSAAMKP
jgi:hypothetical protein